MPMIDAAHRVPLRAGGPPAAAQEPRRRPVLQSVARRRSAMRSSRNCWSSSTPTARSRPRWCWNSPRPPSAGMGPIEHESLAALAERGFRFSLDNVIDLRIDPRDLASRNFRFVKIPASFLLDRSVRRHRDRSRRSVGPVRPLRHRPDRRQDRERGIGRRPARLPTCATARASCSRRRARCGPKPASPTANCRRPASQQSPVRKGPAPPTAHSPRRHSPRMTAPTANPTPPPTQPVIPDVRYPLSPAISKHWRPNYDVVLSDVWGVVHNGVVATPEACDALARYPPTGRHRGADHQCAAARRGRGATPCSTRSRCRARPMTASSVRATSPGR